jgi:hypothetical protein
MNHRNFPAKPYNFVLLSTVYDLKYKKLDWNSRQAA